VIFRYRQGRMIECVFVEERRLVHELFAERVADVLAGRE